MLCGIAAWRQGVQVMPEAPGRSCPLHYRYAPTVFATPAEVACEVLYVVAGCMATNWHSTRC
jgi:hypothetical protein